MSGKYRGFNMAELNMTKIRDFSTYMALTFSKEGRGGETALQRLRETMGGRSWAAPPTTGVLDS